MDQPERTKLLRGKRWPVDRHREEIDVGRCLLFVHWYGYPTAKVGRVTEITRGGKVKVQPLRVHTKDREYDVVTLKEPGSTTLIDQGVVNAFLMSKLASE